MISPAPVEPGYTTTEFWAMVVASLSILIAPVTGHDVPAGEQAALVSILVVVYGFLRTWRKNG